MKNITYILAFLLSYSVFAQVTIIVDGLPENTSKDASIFISGDFEGWSGGHEDYKLTPHKDTHIITLPKTSESILFKFTQGSWKTVECDGKGQSIGNRKYVFKESQDTLRLKIEGWDHLIAAKAEPTIADNVSVLSEDFEMPQLNRKRRIWLYLPPDYHISNEAYPVIYMHDGQNLFDGSTSFSGEWSVDETLNKLYEEKGLKFIVVGIDNGQSKRLDEYSPWFNENYGGGEGNAYLEFITQTLKPYIDRNFRTLKDKANTGIIGSSMGGLISHYAGLKYPNTFGKVGVFSPAFWFNPNIKHYSQTHGNISDTKMYFLAGGKEGGNVRFEEISQTVADMNEMVATLKAKGFNPDHLKSKVVPEGKHNESLWRNNFEESILWLFSETINVREFVSASSKANQLEIQVSDGTYNIQFYNPSIVETTFRPSDTIQNKESHAVVLEPSAVQTSFSETDNAIEFASSGMSVSITKQPFNISYSYKGEPLISEKRGYYKSAHKPLDIVKTNIVADETEKIEFNLTEDEVLYGGGARALGMNRRGHRLPLFNRAHYGYETESALMNYTMPIVMSSQKYLIHFDNAPIGYLDLDSKSNNTLTYETISGRKTYQVIAGNTWYDIIDNYTDLTGKQPMLPRWALGNFSSRFGYHSQKETIETINKFKEAEIPVDAIILDLYWFGKDIKGTMGNLEFHRDSFPNPKQMIKDLRSKDVETILITEPFILTTSHRWEEAVSNNILAKDSIGNPAKYDFYFGNTGIIDIYNKEGNRWFKNIYKNLSKFGVTGFWGDLGEPEVHPSWVQHATGTADEVHNIYGHDWAKLVYESSLETASEQRPFILMRAGYSGSQRYGMVPWSGDVNRTWGGLQSQPEIALQMGMQGLGYMHSDLGGFAGANLDDELYARWLQYGVFQPIYRPHAQEEVASEPVFRSEKAKALAKEAIELRYRMLPYNYNLVFENSQTGAPLMRPLFFEEETNKMLLEEDSMYFWGNDFLVAPVTYAKAEKQTMYFPKSSNWFDFYSNKTFKGGSIVVYDLEENTIPTFVRGGAFIPMSKTIQSTKAYDANDVIVHYYFDASLSKSKRRYYNDDGKTVKAFEKGMYEILEFASEFKNNTLDINFQAAIGKQFNAQDKSITLVIRNITAAPKQIKVGQQKVNVNYNSKKQTLSIPVKWNTSEDKHIQIKLKK